MIDLSKVEGNLKQRVIDAIDLTIDQEDWLSEYKIALENFKYHIEDLIGNKMIEIIAQNVVDEIMDTNAYKGWYKNWDQMS